MRYRARIASTAHSSGVSPRRSPDPLEPRAEFGPAGRGEHEPREPGLLECQGALSVEREHGRDRPVEVCGELCLLPGVVADRPGQPAQRLGGGDRIHGQAPRLAKPLAGCGQPGLALGSPEQDQQLGPLLSGWRLSERTLQQPRRHLRGTLRRAIAGRPLAARRPP